MSASLSLADERELVTDYQAGDILAGAAIVRQYEGLVHSVVRPLVTARAELDDLLQVGRMAILRAAKGYDPALGGFSTYAYYSVRGYAGHYAKKQRYVVAGANRAAVERGRAFTVPVSLDAPLPGGGTVGDRVAAPPSDEPTVATTPLLARLHGRERETIKRHYGDEEETLEQIGRSWGVSRERVRQIKERALDRLRRAALEAA